MFQCAILSSVTLIQPFRLKLVCCVLNACNSVQGMNKQWPLLQRDQASGSLYARWFYESSDSIEASTLEKHKHSRAKGIQSVSRFLSRRYAGTTSISVQSANFM